LRIQTGRILERGQLDLTNLRHPFLAGDRHRHGAVVAHRHITGAGRDGDGGRQRHAIGVHQLPLRIRMEGAIAGIAGRAVGHLQLEETVAADGKVEAVAGLLQVALREDALRRRRARAKTDGKTRRILRIGAALCACSTQVLINKILKLCTNLLGAEGIDIRNVVRNDVHVVLLRLHARSCGPKCSHHNAKSPIYSKIKILLPCSKD